MRDLVAVPLQHDTPGEIAQPTVRDWTKGECEAVPGVTMPNLVVMERDYVNLYNRFISLGPVVQREGIGTHGIRWSIEDLYQKLLDGGSTETWAGQRYPSLNDAASSC